MKKVLLLFSVIIILGLTIVVQLSRQKFKHFIMNRYL